jgi:hypothetical protein
MSGPAARRAKLLVSVYRAWGVAAVWTRVSGGTPLTPTVRHRSEDEVIDFGDSSALRRANRAWVRKSEVPEPKQGDTFVDEEGSFKVIAEPRLEPNGLEWLCEISGG